MRCFQNIAKLIRSKRLGHQKNYSQSELSHLLGYKNGQFISNVERSLCNIPLKMLRRVSEILDIPSEDLKLAILKDQESTLNRYLYGPWKRKGEDIIEDEDRGPNEYRENNHKSPLLQPEAEVHRLGDHKKRKIGPLTPDTSHPKSPQEDDDDDYYRKDVA